MSSWKFSDDVGEPASRARQPNTTMWSRKRTFRAQVEASTILATRCDDVPGSCSR
jgi:hypothetical protein